MNPVPFSCAENGTGIIYSSHTRSTNNEITTCISDRVGGSLFDRGIRQFGNELYIEMWAHTAYLAIKATTALFTPDT